MTRERETNPDSQNDTILYRSAISTPVKDAYKSITRRSRKGALRIRFSYNQEPMRDLICVYPLRRSAGDVLDCYIYYLPCSRIGHQRISTLIS